jgi:DNA-directed RNA polymerase specialized sigma24 family protein
MHYVDGMSQVEIAETLGITRRTVFSRLRKVAQIGRDLLDGDRRPRRRHINDLRLALNRA